MGESQIIPLEARVFSAKIIQQSLEANPQFKLPCPKAYLNQTQPSIEPK